MEFDYLFDSGISLPSRAVSNPVFPLVQSKSKNLIKAYFNDVGLYNTMRITTLGGLSAVLSIHEVDKGVAEWL